MLKRERKHYNLPEYYEVKTLGSGYHINPAGFLKSSKGFPQGA